MSDDVLPRVIRASGVCAICGQVWFRDVSLDPREVLYAYSADEIIATTQRTAAMSVVSAWLDHARTHAPHPAVVQFTVEERP